MRRKTGPLRARFQFVGAGADITFQRGTTADKSVAIWEDGRQFIGSNNLQYDALSAVDNTESRMPAMRTPQPENRKILLASMTKRCLKMPALCLAHQEVAEHLHARDRFSSSG